MIIIDNSLSVFSILVSWLNVECNPLRSWHLYQLYSLAASVNLRDSFGVLDVVSWVYVPKLNRHAIMNPLTKTVIDQVFVVLFVGDPSFFESLHSFLLYSMLVYWFLNKFHGGVIFFLLLAFGFSSELFFCIITQLWCDLEDHIADVWNMRAMQLRARLDVYFGWIESKRCKIATGWICI